MNLSKALFLLLVSTMITFSCKDQKETSQPVQTNDVIAENLINLEVDIEGMTCEIGCAKLIESKLVKSQGVKFAEVDFEDKKGQIIVDVNQLSENEVVNVIENIAGGDLYKVVNIEKVSGFELN